MDSTDWRSSQKTSTNFHHNLCDIYNKKQNNDIFVKDSNWFTKGAVAANWRDISLPYKSNAYKMFNKKKENKIDKMEPDITKQGAKICHGDNCGLSLSLDHFGYNANMEDKTDTYCIACNKRKRLERYNKRKEKRTSTSLEVRDALELFCDSEEGHGKFTRNGFEFNI